MKKDRRSPLKDSPLRNPAQSVQEQLDDQLYDHVLAPFIMVVISVLFAGLEWWNYFHPHPPAPIFYSILSCIVIVYAVYKIWRAWPRLSALKQARDGEKAVGQYREALREQGFRVPHDVVGKGFNIDHVLVGPAGVFTVETKTISKPAHGEAKITFDGQSVSIDGYQPDRNPVTQAKAQAGWLKDLIGQSTGRTVRVWPVVVYPGWFVESSPQSYLELWVLNHKALPSFLAKEPVRITPENIQLVNYHLSR